MDLVRTVRDAQGARLGEEARERGVAGEPAPPWIWMATSTTCWSTLGAATLMAEISVIASSGADRSIFHAA